MQPARKKMRLSGWDYSTEAAYFLTLCTKDKRPMLSHIVGHLQFNAPDVVLSQYGCLVQNALLYLSDHNPGIIIHNWVIMPNHVHVLLSVTNEGMLAKGASGMSRPTEAMIPRFVSSLKRFTNKQSGMDLWQTSYYDHIIRNDEDFLRRWRYIDNNPSAWLDDDYYIK